MKIARVLQILATLTAVVAMAIGMGVLTNPDFRDPHMLVGLGFVLILLILSVMALFTKELRIRGVIGIVYALILPVFGAKQEAILPNPDVHWLVQATHLAISFAAIPFMGAISAGLMRRKAPGAAVSPVGNEAKQAQPAR